jgi:glycosyltransferase involved in cell wall biosynthesis
MSKYGVGADSWLVRLLKYLERVSFNFADYVITITEPIQELLIERGLPRSRSVVIMNSADEARFGSSPNPADTSKDSDTFVMMYHGTLTRIYGLDIAIEAFSLAHADMPGSELRIVGSGPEETVLASLVRERGLGASIKMPGSVPAAEIPGWLRECDLGILPIRRDVFLDFAFPNKLPEFIIMGIPVLMSRLKTIRHYFRTQQSCRFGQANDSDLSGSRDACATGGESQAGIRPDRLGSNG